MFGISLVRFCLFAFVPCCRWFCANLPFQIDDRPQELLYVSVHNLSVELEDTASQQTVKLGVGKLQIDNQVFIGLVRFASRAQV